MSAASRFLCALAAGLPWSVHRLSAAEPAPLVFRDVGEEAGLFPHAEGIRGHGVACGDVDGNGWPDLFITTFHNSGSKPAMLLRNEKGVFRPDPAETLHVSGLGSGALLVDLANQGRLDLYVSHCAHGAEGLAATPSLLFRNDGDGRFADISKESGACPPGYAGRGLAALDYDGDGLLDLAGCEQYYSPAVKTGPLLLRNLGGHRFERAEAKAGLPAGLGGLGVAAADVNQDTWPDLFFTSGAGDHRLLVNDGKGSFREPAGARAVFRWKTATPDDTPAGVCIADLNRDGWPDIVIGNHFKSPWITPAPVRLYLHRGVRDGDPVFEDVTDAAGITPLAMKAPHVEIQDFDNDGWPDILVSIVKFAEGRPHPVIFRNLGPRGGVPCFRAEAWSVNDYPTPEDAATRGSTRFFEKMLRERKVIYMAAAPTLDFDRDGRLDVFLASWWLESRSLLLRNETSGGAFLDVRVEGGAGINRMGVGATVSVYPAGRLGEPDALLGAREIATGYGYCSGQEAVAHFGLGATGRVDVEVRLPGGKGLLVRRDVPAGQRILLGP